MLDANLHSPILSTRRSRLTACSLALLLGSALSSPALASAPFVDYRITADPGLRGLAVEMCFPSPPPSASLIVPAALGDAIRDIVAVAPDGRETTLVVAANRLSLPYDPFACINYNVPLPRDRTDNRRADVHWHGDAVMIALDRILLRPAWQRRWLNTRLTFDLPDSIAVAAPGRELASVSARRVFALHDRPHGWHGDIALGKLTNTTLDIQGTSVRVSVVGAASAPTLAVLRAWVDAGARAVAKLYGRFPVHDTQVFVVPLGPGPDPVPWGEVVRGGGDAVHLYVDGNRGLAELNANWVLCHELSHLLHPYVSHGGSWLPEGIASYYQNVARARAGLLEPAAAWKKLESGFARGRQQTTGGRALADATNTLMHAGQYMRVYWSGAAIALIADVELRRQSNGAMSLDRVLDELGQCCLPTRNRWRPAMLMAKMDAIAGTDTFMRLYEMYVKKPVFPDVGEVFNSLGLGPQQPPAGSAAARVAADLRRAIMGAD